MANPWPGVKAGLEAAVLSVWGNTTPILYELAGQRVNWKNRLNDGSLTTRYAVISPKKTPPPVPDAGQAVVWQMPVTLMLIQPALSGGTLPEIDTEMWAMILYLLETGLTGSQMRPETLWFDPSPENEVTAVFAGTGQPFYAVLVGCDVRFGVVVRP